MRITEKVLVILFLIGFVMLQTEVPGGLIFTTLSSVLLGLLYILFAFALFNGIRLRRIFKRESYQGLWAGSLIIAVISGIIIGVSAIAVLFNAAHWPGNGMLRFLVLIPLGAICIMSLVIAMMKEPIGKPVLARALPVFIFVLYYLYKYNLSYMM